MRKVKFKGTPHDIGRFGVVAKGQILLLTIGEWRGVEGNAHFVPVDTAEIAEAEELAKGLFPFGSSVFDLRTVPWENPRLFDQLCARASRNQLKAMVDAMKLVGAVMGDVDFDCEKIYAVDAIVHASVIMGWDKLTPEQRLGLPSVHTNPDGTVDIPEVDLNRKPGEPQGPFTNTTSVPLPRFDKNGQEVDREVKPTRKPLRKRNPKKVTKPRKRGKLNVHTR